LTGWEVQMAAYVIFDVEIRDTAHAVVAVEGIAP
jgi:hypothetical protein